MLFALILISCSDEPIETYDSSQNLKLTSEFKTNIGTYKGVFTTLDSEFRGQIEVKIMKPNSNSFAKNYHIAKIILQTGDVIYATSNEKFRPNYPIDQAIFMSNELIFNFSVDGDGSNPIISNVIYNNTAADIMIAKHTNLAPVEPITGTYFCFACDGHPILDGTDQTFNMMFTTDASGISEITTQVLYDGLVYDGIALQNNCNVDGTFTSCDMESGNGVDSDEGFIIGVNPVKWQGRHDFNIEDTGPNDCSETWGFWSINTSNNGFVFGGFKSDPISDCPASINTISSNGFDAFTGAGFAPIPSAGQLDSDIIIANGFNNVSLDYGETQNSGVYAKGESTGGEAQPGIYAFDVGGGDIALGVAPGQNDFTPGYIEIKLNNDTGNNLTSFKIDYDIYVYNDKSQVNSLNFSYSDDGTDYINIDDLDFVSPGAADASPSWVLTHKSAEFYVTIPNGQNLYMRFTGDSGRDEIAIDNISLVEAD